MWRELRIRPRQDGTTFEIHDPVEDRFEQAAGTLSGPRQNHIAIRSRETGNVWVTRGTAAGKRLDTAEFFISPDMSFQPAAEIASGDNSVPSITIGILNADATLRRAKTYQAMKPITASPGSEHRQF